MNEINSHHITTATPSITSVWNVFMSCVSNLKEVSEVSINTMNMPVNENDLYTCVRTTIRVGNKTISMDGYADKSSVGSDNPCEIVDRAKQNSMCNVMGVLRCTMDNNMENQNNVIDITTHTESHISIPERFCTDKYSEPHTKAQENKIYYVANERGMSADEFSMKVLGKELSTINKGEAAYLIQYKN